MAAKNGGVKKKAVFDKGELIASGKLIASMMNVFIRGEDEGDKKVRAARLVEGLYELAIKSESPAVRLAATKEIMDRIDGKVAERKEIKSVRIEGIVYIPEAAENPLICDGMEA